MTGIPENAFLSRHKIRLDSGCLRNSHRRVWFQRQARHTFGVNQLFVSAIRRRCAPSISKSRQALTLSAYPKMSSTTGKPTARSQDYLTIEIYFIIGLIITTCRSKARLATEVTSRTFNLDCQSRRRQSFVTSQLRRKGCSEALYA